MMRIYVIDHKSIAEDNNINSDVAASLSQFRAWFDNDHTSVVVHPTAINTVPFNVNVFGNIEAVSAAIIFLHVSNREQYVNGLYGMFKERPLAIAHYSRDGISSLSGINSPKLSEYKLPDSQRLSDLLKKTDREAMEKFVCSVSDGKPDWSLFTKRFGPPIHAIAEWLRYQSEKNEVQITDGLKAEFRAEFGSAAPHGGYSIDALQELLENRYRK